MPIFEYRCRSCNETFEVLVRASDPTPVVHEKCQTPAVERIFSVPSLKFIGSGFYKTDYAPPTSEKD